MSVELKMPALSPTMEEGKLARWLVKEGDEIQSGDILAEIETDKATMEFEAVDEGRIGKILVPEGTEVIFACARAIAAREVSNSPCPLVLYVTGNSKIGLTVPSGRWHSSTTVSNDCSAIQAAMACSSWSHRSAPSGWIPRSARMSPIVPMITSLRYVAVWVYVYVEVDVEVLMRSPEPSARARRGRRAQRT